MLWMTEILKFAMDEKVPTVLTKTRTTVLTKTRTAKTIARGQKPKVSYYYQQMTRNEDVLTLMT